MTAENDANPMKEAIVRIKTESGKVVGAGFLVDDNHVLTCDHVVIDAWVGLDEKEKQAHTLPVCLDFPFIPVDNQRTTYVKIFNAKADIALLELEQTKPNDAKAPKIKSSENLWGHRFRAYGVPVNFDKGEWASGVIMDTVGTDLLQIQDDKVPGTRVRQGFSGTPLWDETLQGVVGMVSRENTEASDKMAFATPCNVIKTIYPELKVESAAPTAAINQAADALLPDNTKITKLNIDDAFLDKRYEEALNKAKESYDDAQLSYFYLSVSPFYNTDARINCRFIFYSKWADKTCIIDWFQYMQKLVHVKPDKPAKYDTDKRIMDILPWKSSPLWEQALDKIYQKIPPLSSVEESWYYLANIFSSNQTYWRFWCLDGETGNEYNFYWDGKGFDEKSILDYWNYDDPFSEEKDPLLPDNTQITKLSLDKTFLDGLYAEVLKKANTTCSDAKLNGFGVWVYPYSRVGSRVSPSFEFYSKEAKKQFGLAWSQFTNGEWSELSHSNPVYPAKTLECLPWKASTVWTEALDKAYKKVSNTTQIDHYSFNSLTSFDETHYWLFRFCDKNGTETSIYWDGSSLDDSSFKCEWSYDEPFPEGFSLTDKEKIIAYIDKRYEEALKKAIETNNDAQLSDFSLNVNPFHQAGTYYPRISGQFSFYSKWADKISNFQWYGNFDEGRYCGDKRAKYPNEREVLTGLPWKENVLWFQAIGRLYSKIGPLAVSDRTSYKVGSNDSFLNKEYDWCFVFFDCSSENYTTIYWDGKGLDADNFKMDLK